MYISRTIMYILRTIKAKLKPADQAAQGNKIF